MKLSPNFTLEELTRSSTAVEAGIQNTPGEKELDNLHYLARVLEQVRHLVGKPVSVTSGYRSKELNDKISGSSSTSAHMRGMAADINVDGISPIRLAILIKNSDIDFDQLILEKDSWVHIGLREKNNRRQTLTIRKGTGYLPGLVPN